VGLLAPLAGVLLFGLAVGAGSLLVAGSALAEMALFRVEQSWHNYPNPAVTSPGGAGMYQSYLQPYVVPVSYLPPATAIVEPGNPVGGAFTLPQSFFGWTGFTETTAGNPWNPGYHTHWYLSYYNGPGKFRPNNGATGPTRIVFPTTMGNPYPTYTSTDQKWINGNDGDGNPVTPTTTFDGRYDMSRGGSIAVTPGPRRFGGTMRWFYGPNAGIYQYVWYFTAADYKAYGDYICLDEGKFGCTPSTFVSNIGDTTAYWEFTWYQLNVAGTGTGGQTWANSAKATTPTTPNAKAPTPYGNASFITGMRRYLNQIHPWTTGFAKVHNAKGSVWRTNDPGPITPQAQGYDISLGGSDITVTHYDWNSNWNQQLSTISYSTETYKQYLFGVGRVVSMVRPKLIHDYNVPVDPNSGPITNIYQAARLSRLKVFFVPEPAGMLTLGAGIAVLLGLSRMRRR
jgi:hypothetical protein